MLSKQCDNMDTKRMVVANVTFLFTICFVTKFTCISKFVEKRNKTCKCVFLFRFIKFKYFNSWKRVLWDIPLLIHFPYWFIIFYTHLESNVFLGKKSLLCKFVSEEILKSFHESLAGGMPELMLPWNKNSNGPLYLKQKVYSVLQNM